MRTGANASKTRTSAQTDPHTVQNGGQDPPGSDQKSDQKQPAGTTHATRPSQNQPRRDPSVRQINKSPADDGRKKEPRATRTYLDPPAGQLGWGGVSS